MTRRKVRWAKSARRDLELIVAYLADHTPQAARSTLDRLEARAKSLAVLAERGRIVPELGRLHVQQYRELVIPPYRLIYRIRGTLRGLKLVIKLFTGFEPRASVTSPRWRTSSLSTRCWLKTWTSTPPIRCT